MAEAGKRSSKNLSRLVTFLLLCGFWVIFSGHFDPFHLTLGFLCCLLVALLSHDLLFEDIMAKGRFRMMARFVLYVPWLIYQIVLANLYVAYLALHPRMPLDPRIMRFRSKLRSDIAKVTFANSITLTPGTITMDVEGDEFYVHALSRKVAQDLESGEMEGRVAHIYSEEKEI